MINSTEFHKLIVKRVATYDSQKAAAQAMKVSPQYLGDVLAGRREPGAAILKAMGYYRVIGYEKK